MFFTDGYALLVEFKLLTGSPTSSAILKKLGEALVQTSTHACSAVTEGRIAHCFAFVFDEEGRLLAGVADGSKLSVGDAIRLGAVLMHTGVEPTSTTTIPEGTELFNEALGKITLVREVTVNLSPEVVKSVWVPSSV